MNYLPKYIFVAMALVASLACASTVSAATYTSPSGTIYTGAIKAESEGSVKLSGSFVTVECHESRFDGQVVSDGPGVTVRVSLSSWHFLLCTGATVTTALAVGQMETHAAAGDLGTVTSSGWQFVLHTSVGQCVFATSGTDLGSLTGSTTTKGNATLDVASAKIPRTGGNFLCGASATLSGSYKITTPSTLSVDA